MSVIDAFTVETTSRLTGLSRERLGDWDRSGFFSPSLGNQGRGGVYRRVYSFQDVVGLRTISRMLELGVSHHHLRKVREILGNAGNEGWASQRFYISNQKVFLSRDEAYIGADPKWQAGEPTILDLRDVWEEVDRSVQGLAKREAAQIGQGENHRYVMSGETVIAGTRIPLSTIIEMHRDGFTHEEILCEYPRLKFEDIEYALADADDEEARRTG